MTKKMNKTRIQRKLVNSYETRVGLRVEYAGKTVRKQVDSAKKNKTKELGF